MPHIKSFGHTASEEMSFEIVDDDGRRRMDGRRIPTFGSGELKRGFNEIDYRQIMMKCN